MKKLFLSVCIVFALAATASAALTLNNGNFDNDPDLGGSDDTETAPSGWFTHYTVPQSWSDFRFGAAGNGGWNANGVTFGQNYLGPGFDPGPEDGYYYTSLGAYSGEFGARISGFGYNRINGNPAGGFDVALYYSPTFVGANGVDVAGSSVLLGSIFVDISALTGTTPRNQAFTLNVNFAGSGIQPGDRVWLRLGDGPDNGDLNTFDEPTIDNLTLQIIASPATSYADTVLADGPIAYWRFNDTPPTAINSGTLGAVANGTYLNGASSGAEAPRPPLFVGFEAGNTAMQLDGVDDFMRSMPMLLNGRTNITMSGWIRRAGVQRNRTGLWGQDNLIEFGYIDNLTVQAWVDNFSTPINVPTPFPDLEWDYVALVVDGGALRMTIYTNGVPAGSAALPQGTNYNSLNSTNFFVVGGDTFGGGGVTFNGQIDEVAVFDKALSAAKVADHYFTAVATPPRITGQPQPTNIFEGQDLVLSVSAVGSPTLRYQWQYFGSDLPGQTRSTLVISNATTGDSGSYSVRVSNDYGFVDSDFVDVEVMPTQPPTITQEPLSQSRYAGRTARFTVTATGGARLRYQWQFNSMNLVNETNSALVLNNISAANAGPYRVIVINNVGSVTSMVATLTVLTPAAGSYEAAVVGAGPIAYWRLGETSGSTAFDYWGGYDGTYSQVTLGIPGAIIGDPNTAAEFNGTNSVVTTPLRLNTFSNATLTGWVRRGGEQGNRTGLWGQDNLIEFGYIDNSTLQLWVDDFDTPVNVPNSFPDGEWDYIAVVIDGDALRMTVYTNGLAGGSAALPGNNYDSFNSTASFVIGGDTFGNGRSFRGGIDEVAVFDKALTQEQVVNQYVVGRPGPPIIARQPQGTNLFEGGTLRICVEAFGSPPLSYRWLFFGTEVPGQTDACYVVQNATPADSGPYQVEVTNPHGTVQSVEVTVDVMPASPPTITQDPQSATRYAGASVTFTAAAIGSDPLSYQWQHNGADVPGATSTTLTLNNLQPLDAGDYRMIAANNVGRATSAVATLTIIVTPPGYASLVVAHEPIAYWRLGEESGSTAFDYVGGNHGTYNNVIQGVPGALAGDPDLAAEFNGSSSVVTTPVRLNALSNITMTGWVRRGGTQQGRTGLFGQDNLIEFGYIDNDTLQLWVDNFETPVNVANPFPDGEWDFIAVVIDGNALQMTVYTNGQAGGSAPIPGNNYDSLGSTARFVIGGDTFGNGVSFLGGIDDVALFDRALAPNQITSLYLVGTGQANQCPVANSISVTTAQGMSVTFQLPASDPDGDPLVWSISQPASHGVIAHNNSTGEAAYLPNPGYCGPDSFKFRVSDLRCDSAEATVSITVNCPNGPPVCVARVVPEECQVVFGTDPNLYVIALNDADACVILDGSGSSDPDGDALQFLWLDGTNVVGTSAVITNCLEVGCHTITLMVSDGRDRCSTTLTVCVITASEAVEQCVLLVENTTVDRKNKRPLIASLKAAAASFERGNFESGMNQLEAFQNKVRAQISGANPAEAEAFIACTQGILDAINCAAVVAEHGVGRPPPR